MHETRQIYISIILYPPTGTGDTHRILWQEQISIIICYLRRWGGRCFVNIMLLRIRGLWLARCGQLLVHYYIVHYTVAPRVYGYHILLYLFCCSQLWRNLTMHNAQWAFMYKRTFHADVYHAIVVVVVYYSIGFLRNPNSNFNFLLSILLFLNISFLFSVLVTVSIRPYNIYTYTCK